MSSYVSRFEAFSGTYEYHGSSSVHLRLLEELRHSQIDLPSIQNRQTMVLDSREAENPGYKKGREEQQITSSF
jgi:hypothetical protein